MAFISSYQTKKSQALRSEDQNNFVFETSSKQKLLATAALS